MSFLPCQCCLTRVDISERPVDPVACTQLVFECFSIQMATEKNLSGYFPTVCPTCVCKLNESLAFKNLIRETQSVLQAAALSENDDLLSVENEMENSNSSIDSIEKAIAEDITCEISHISYKAKSKRKKNGKRSKTKSLETTPPKDAIIKDSRLDNLAKCPICDSVVKKSSYKHHVGAHNGLRLHPCPVSGCSERFKSSSKQRMHMHTVHDVDVYKYECPHCPKKFVLQGILNAHVRKVHDGEKSKTCDVCAYRCYSIGKLKNHMLRHNGERTHACVVCSKAFVRKDTLREHMKIHTSHKAIKCGTCGVGFTYAASLRSHVAKVHGEMIRSVVESNSS